MKSTLRRDAWPRASTSERNGGLSTKHHSAPTVRAAFTTSRHAVDDRAAHAVTTNPTAPDDPAVEPDDDPRALERGGGRSKPERAKERHRDDVEERSQSGGRSRRRLDGLPPARELPALPLERLVGRNERHQPSAGRSRGTARGRASPRFLAVWSRAGDEREDEPRLTDVDRGRVLQIQDTLGDELADSVGFSFARLDRARFAAVEEAGLRLS